MKVMPDVVTAPTIAGLFPPATRQLHEHRPILYSIRWRTGVERLEDLFLPRGLRFKLAQHTPLVGQGVAVEDLELRVLHPVQPLRRLLVLRILQCPIDFVQHVLHGEFPKLAIRHDLDENLLVAFHAINDEALKGFLEDVTEVIL